MEERIKEKEASLVRQLQALQGISESSEWRSLKTELFDGLADSLTKRLLSEAKKEKPDIGILNRLSGQLEWASRYADLDKFIAEKKAELTNIRNNVS